MDDPKTISGRQEKAGTFFVYTIDAEVKKKMLSKKELTIKLLCQLVEAPILISMQTEHPGYSAR